MCRSRNPPPPAPLAHDAYQPRDNVDTYAAYAPRMHSHRRALPRLPGSIRVGDACAAEVAVNWYLIFSRRTWGRSNSRRSCSAMAAVMPASTLSSGISP